MLPFFKHSTYRNRNDEIACLKAFVLQLNIDFKIYNAIIVYLST